MKVTVPASVKYSINLWIKELPKKKKKVALLLHKIVGKQIRQRNSEQRNGCAAQCTLQKHCQEFWLKLQGSRQNL